MNVPLVRRVAGIAGFGIFLLLLAKDAVPHFRGVGEWGPSPEWRWKHAVGGGAGAAVLLWMLAMAAALVVRRVTGQPWGGWRRAAAMGAGAGLLLIALQAVGWYVREPRVGFLWGQRATIGWINSFWSAGQAISGPAEAFSRIAELRMSGNYPRVPTHPPGAIAYYSGWLQLAKALGLGGQEGWAGWRAALEPLPEAKSLSAPAISALVLSTGFLPIAAALSLLPLFDLLRRQWGWKTAARVSVFFGATPAVVLFSPVPDLLILPCVSGALWAFSLGIRANPTTGAKETGPGGPGASLGRPEVAQPPLPAKTLLLIAGGFIAVHSLFSYSFAPVLLVFLLWRTLLIWRDTSWGWRPKDALPRVLVDAALLLAPIVALWLLLRVTLDFSYFANWAEGVRAHREGITHYRSYWKWLLFNPWDVLLFAGLPAALMLARGLRLQVGWASPLLWSLLLVLLTMNLSGAVRGETARIWLFAYPLLAPFVAPVLADHRGGAQAFPWWMGLQAAQTAVMVAVLNVY